MIQSIPRNTYTQRESEKTNIILPCFDPHDFDNNNNNNNNNKISLLLSFSWPLKEKETKMVEYSNAGYVHPLSKASSSFLSANSLEMCTESLGSETGSNIHQFDFEELMINMEERQRQRQRQRGIQPPQSIKKAKHGGGGGGFPPPLTSISGSECVRVRTHREGGRLVIKAFTLSSSGSNSFVAERGNGRLRLSLLKDCSGGEGGGGEEEEEEDEVDDEEEVDWENNGLCGKVGCVINGNGNGNGGSSRCNGDTSSRKRLHTLPFCVAIS